MDDCLGWDVAIASSPAGTIAIAGAPGPQNSATSFGPGRAVLYRLDGTQWTEDATPLTPIDGGNNDRYGRGVAIAGGTALVGAPLMDEGAAYVYTGLLPSDCQSNGVDDWIDVAGPGVVELRVILDTSDSEHDLSAACTAIGDLRCLLQQSGIFADITVYQIVSTGSTECGSQTLVSNPMATPVDLYTTGIDPDSGGMIGDINIPPDSVPNGDAGQEDWGRAIAFAAKIGWTQNTKVIISVSGEIHRQVVLDTTEDAYDTPAKRTAKTLAVLDGTAANAAAATTAEDVTVFHVRTSGSFKDYPTYIAPQTKRW